MGWSRRTRVPQAADSLVFDSGTTAFRNWSARGEMDPTACAQDEYSQ